MSFTERRAKRLAGPGFYLNCKFDQSSFESRKNSTQGTSQTSDPLGLHVENSNLENYDIKEMELLFVETGSRDYGLRVLSSLNGVTYTAEGDNKNMVKQLLKKYRFIGTAQTDHVANDRNAINQGLSASAAGIVTIQNNSTSHIHPGELLKVDYIKDSKNSIRGMPRNKKTFCLVPYQKKDEIDAFFKDSDIDTIIGSSIPTLVAANNPVDAARTKATIDDIITQIKGKLSDHSDSLQVVAKAMSYSRPGERLDILLHPRQY